MKINPVKAIIFDLGGVILDIDYHRTIRAFQALGYENFDEQYSQMKQSGLFDQLEKGLISPDDFRSQLLASLPNRTPEDIDDAWNSLLLDFPEGRLEFVGRLKSKTQTYLLSNTNAIHYKAFSAQLQREQNGAQLEDFFHKAYLSHEVHLRKPEPEIFQLILDDHSLAPSETLFIDDSPQHIEAAQRLGIQTIHLTDIHALEGELAPFLAQLD